jgi:formate C-acetyltransferase
MLAGLSGVGSLDAGINTLLVLEQTIYDYLETANSFDDFYNEYLQNLQKTVDTVTAEISNSQLSRAKHNPLPMRTLLIDDCIDNGVDFNNGGARYKWSIVSFAGLINAIDSLLTIKEFVFDKKKYTAKELIEKLTANDETALEEMKNCKIAFGRDDEEANAFAKAFSHAVFSMLDSKKPAIGEAFLSASVLFNAQAFGGSFVGATPDGRRANSPLADSVSAIFEKDTNGPTALLRSVTALDLSHALGTPVLNFSVQPDYNFDVLKGLILGYIQSGGMQMQISCVTKEILLDAYDHPEKYPNLVVRVAGFSEYFVNLSDELKKAVIARSIQNLK